LSTHQDIDNTKRAIAMFQKALEL
jgi:tetratricopeptide (TPR) repeat protein